MGGSTNVTSTTQQAGSSQADLPAWAKPYFERNLARAEAEYGKPYEAYTGDRYAATGTDTLKARDMTRDISGQVLLALQTHRIMPPTQQIKQKNWVNIHPHRLLSLHLIQHASSLVPKFSSI
jgi:hypothetical protein